MPHAPTLPALLKSTKHGLNTDRLLSVLALPYILQVDDVQIDLREIARKKAEEQAAAEGQAAPAAAAAAQQQPEQRQGEQQQAQQQ